MAQTSRTFRIFVSSTFSDLKEERNALQKYVFPRLRELCMQHGCRFQAIDLRWGVSEEAGLDQQTVKICLQEIKRCQKTTPRPNFVVLLGDRYGWRPLPAEIPAAEYEEIERRVVNTDDQALLKAWYRRDDNAVPAIYCLQARTGDFTDYARWQEVERRLHTVLLQSTEGMTLGPDERVKYTASATEHEIVCGALGVQDAREHVFCFFRQITNRDDLINNLPHSENARDFIDVDENGRPDQEACAQQKELRQRLRDSLPGNIHDYAAEWRSDGITIEQIGTLPETLEGCLGLIEDDTRPSNLCVDVWTRLARVILEEVRKIESVDPLDKEIEDHKNFGEERAQFFTGRAGYLGAISDYVSRTDPHPLALWGESGSGKSAMIARAVADAREARSSARIIEHYIGATPRSSDGRTLLESLCKETTKHYGEVEQSVPTEYQKLVKEFQQRLELATEDKPLIIFLDALDQLSDNEHARNLAWLPNKLPPHVRVIVSTLPGECLSHLERKLPADSLLKLDPMTSSEGDELLDLWLADAKRRLEPAQRESVLKEFRVNGLPLYLKLVFEEARPWKSNSLAQAFPADIPGMIRAMLRRLMADHGQMLIERALGYIAAARHGLSEDELLDVLSMDKEVFDDFLERAHHKPPEQRLPVVVWSRLYFDLEPYLTERSADGANLLGFYHRQLGEVVTGEFLAGEAKRERHIALGKFFADQDYFLETLEAQRERARRLPPTARPANLRKASELAWQLLRAEQWEELEQALTGLFFLECKAEAGMVFDLVRDFNEAVKRIPDEHPQRRILLLLEEAVRRDVHFIARHPTTLFQCFWNTGWWYDCAEAAAHYNPPEAGWGAEGPPWNQRLPQLHRMLEDWREAKERDFPGFMWIRSVRPPIVPLGVGLASTFRGHTSIIAGVAFSSDGRKVATGSSDGSVRLWDTQSGAPLLEIAVPKEKWLLGLAISLDGARIAFSTINHIFVCDAATGEIVTNIEQEAARCIAISPDGRTVAFAAGGGFSRSGLFTLEIGSSEPFRFPKCPRATTSIKFSHNGKLILTGDEDGLIGIWEVANGEPIHCLGGLNSWGICGTAFSSDERYIVSGLSNGWVDFWDTATGEQLGSHCVGDFISGLVVLPDDNRVVISHYNGIFRFLNRQTGEMWGVAGPGDHGVHSLGIAPNGRFLASGLSDGTLQIWDVESARPMPLLPGHKQDISRLTMSDDGNSILSEDRDSGLQWDWGFGFCQDSARGNPVAPVQSEDSCWQLVPQGWESAIHNTQTNENHAWFPAAFEKSVSHREPRRWAASTGGRHLYLVALEGDV